MSTRCRVAVKNQDGTYHSIYGHYDGYPHSYDTGECDAVGQKLASFYTDPDVVANLIGLGDFSVLGNTLERTEFFGRDYKEAGVDSILANSLEELFAQSENSGAEWIYVYENNHWYYHRQANDGTSWMLL
jgi:hypothetical protein